jgi:molybdopterin molybdotransferase
MSEPPVDGLITVAEASAILDAVEVEPRREAVPLASALGRRLAEAIVADRDYPPFNKALMDGYAVRAGEPAGVFELVGEVPAGTSWTGRPLSGRQAVTIMTGAPLPRGEGEVGIVPVEQSRPAGEGKVLLDVSAEPSRFISRRGSDRPAGSVVLRPGALIGPRQLAVLASVGVASVPVFSPPRCAVLATGDELVAAGQSPAEHQIRNSNSPTLLALVERLGGDVVDGGHVPDDLDATRHALGEWLASSSDCLFITGGMSMGERDFVPRVLRELGVELRITKLKIKPGKPFVFGMATRERGFVAGEGTGRSGGARRGVHTSYVFGLPGNPVSSYVCTLVLAGRLLLRLAGGATLEADGRFTEVPLSADLEANGPRQFYQPARLVKGAAQPLRWRGSADVFTLAEADALIERPANDPPRLAGQPVRLVELP